MPSVTTDGKIRCAWCTGDDIYMRYHDSEWGVPVHDDRRQFEFLILESFQAGLSWITILRKRENFRRAFQNFKPEKVADYGEKDIRRLLADSGIIRNRPKIAAAIANAKAVLKVQEEFGSFAAYIWDFVGGRTIKNRWKRTDQIPARTEVSEAMSSGMISRGFRFVGPVVCYSHMQATGLVNDHLTACFRYEECAGSR